MSNLDDNRKPKLTAWADIVKRKSPTSEESKTKSPPVSAFEEKMFRDIATERIKHKKKQDYQNWVKENIEALRETYSNLPKIGKKLSFDQYVQYVYDSSDVTCEALKYKDEPYTSNGQCEAEDGDFGWGDY